MVRLALTGLNILSMINFCYFPKDFLGISVLTSQKVEKCKKKKRHLKQQICLFLLISIRDIGDMKKLRSYTALKISRALK